MNSSILYTIGTALSRAQENDVPVQVLVEGEIRGTQHVITIHADAVRYYEFDTVARKAE